MSKPVYEVATISDINVTVDVSLLPDREMYFNATQIAKEHSKKVDDFLRLKSTKEYISVLEEERKFKVGNSRLKNWGELVVVKRGKYGGTWMHNELAYEFAGWCSALFRRQLHKYVEKRIEQEAQRQHARLEAKTGFAPLTEAIKIAHEEPKPYHFSNECNLINKIVLGMTAKQYREKHNVTSVREYLTDHQLEAIAFLQRMDEALHYQGKKYEERKEILQDLYKTRFGLLVAA